MGDMRNKAAAFSEFSDKCCIKHTYCSTLQLGHSHKIRVEKSPSPRAGPQLELDMRQGIVLLVFTSRLALCSVPKLSSFVKVLQAIQYVRPIRLGWSTQLYLVVHPGKRAALIFTRQPEHFRCCSTTSTHWQNPLG